LGDEPRPLVDQLGDPLPDGAVARLGTVRFRQPDFVCSLAFAPDGKTLLSGGSAVRLWDAATGRPLGRFADLPKRESITGCGLAFAPDGKSVCCAGYGGIASWELATRKLLFHGLALAHRIPIEEAPFPEGSPLNPEAETFSPDTTRLAWINPDGSISLWE